MTRSLLACLVVATLIVLSASAQLDPVAQEVLKNMDWDTSPCVDFYNFSCGGWMASHPIPGDKSRIDRSFEVIGEYNTNILIKIAENPSSGRVHDFYTACMNTSQIEVDALAPLTQLWSLLTPSYTSNMATLFKNGLSAFFDIAAEIDSSDPAHIIYSVHQGGLTLPDRSYYTDSNLTRDYAIHIQKMFILTGGSVSSATQDAKNVLVLEAALAGITVPQDQLFDPFATFNKMSWSDLDATAPGVQFLQVAAALNFNTAIGVTIDAPAYFKQLSGLLASSDAQKLFGSYFKWRVLHWLAPRLPAAIAQENFNFFGTILGGVTVPPARSKTCLQQADAVMPELLGRLYAEQAFPASSKVAATEIFDAIISSFEINVQKLDWMDPDTMNKALDKLEKILRLIGYPENPRNYTNYNFNEHYVSNILMTTRDAWARQMATAGGPSDRHQWDMSADTVNAYYSPTSNIIVIPAGILQSPFFNPDFPPAMNYGGIGMVAGHELTHSLDSQGRDYNGEGKLIDWWAPQTSAQFQQRVDCIINQYSGFSPLPGYYVNGNLTQGENIADAGGLKTAHAAYMNSYFNIANQPSIVPQLTNEQLFFVGFAQSWCSKLTPPAIKQRLLTDPHSPPRFRVNGPSINLPAFANAFQCPVGSPMNPTKRCQIW